MPSFRSGSCEIANDVASKPQITSQVQVAGVIGRNRWIYASFKVAIPNDHFVAHEHIVIDVDLCFIDSCILVGDGV